MIVIIVFVLVFLLLLLVSVKFLPKLLKSSIEEEITREEGLVIFILGQNLINSNESLEQVRPAIIPNNQNIIAETIETNYPPEDQHNNNLNQIPYDRNYYLIVANKKLTKKEIQKMEKKKMKADNQEIMKQMLEQKKLREQEREKEQQEREKKREEEEKKEEELLIRMKMEQQMKEEEMLNQWKGEFTIAETGEDNLDFSNENLIEDFLNYIKIRKVVSLEDLSGEFKINSAELVDRLQQFEKQGRICGIIDDRGKYIYITDKELAVN